MSLFCFLFIPALVLWRRSLPASARLAPGSPGLIAGFIFGLLAGYVRFNVGFFFAQRDFGILAYLAQLIDGPAWDALLPLGAYALLRTFPRPRKVWEEKPAVAFAFAWIIPVAAARAMRWSSLPDPTYLVAVPVLMSVLVLAVPYWANKFAEDFGFSRVVDLFVAVALPLVATLCTWAFLTNRYFLGLLAFAVSFAAGARVFYSENPFPLPKIRFPLRRSRP